MDGIVGPSKRRAQSIEGPSSSVKRIKFEESSSCEVEFPEDVLAKIFHHSQPREKKQLILVKKSWSKIMEDPLLGQDLKFNLSHAPINSEVYQVFMQSERQILHVTVQYNDLPDHAPIFPDAIHQNSTNFFTKVGQHVRVLKITNQNTQIKSLKHFPLLEKLIVDTPRVFLYLRDISPSLKAIHFEKVREYLPDDVSNAIFVNENLEEITAHEVDLNEENFLEFQEYPLTDFASLPSKANELHNLYSHTRFFLKSHINLMYDDKPMLTMDDIHIKIGEFGDFNELVYIDYTIGTFDPVKEADIYISHVNKPESSGDHCWYTHDDKNYALPNLEKVKMDNVETELTNCKKCLKFFAENTPKLTKLNLKASTASHFVPLLKFGHGFTDIQITAEKVPINPLKIFQGLCPKFALRFDILKVLVLTPVKCVNPADWNNWPAMPNLEELRLELYYRSVDRDNAKKGKVVPNPAIGIENIAKKCRQVRVFELSNEIHKLSCTQLKVFLKEWPFLIAFHTDGITHKHEMRKLPKDDVFTHCNELDDYRTGFMKRLDAFCILRIVAEKMEIESARRVRNSIPLNSSMNW